MAEADDARGMEPETREQSGDERQEGVETLNEGEDGECGGGDCEVYYAVGDYTAQDDSQVCLKDAEQVRVLQKSTSEWWWVEVGNLTGYVPTTYLSEKNPFEGVDLWQDEEYFSSYGDVKLHLEMLADKPRTLAYRSAVENSQSYIKDKVVMDLGCGTGILSLFCARLGEARKVYAVEASEMAEHARAVVHSNGLSEQIEVIQSKAEQLSLPEKVDLIISEWMGTLLLFELMLESVLLARDTWLKDDGVVWPSEAELFLVPCSAEESYGEKVAFWNSVYGFDFSVMIPLAKSEYLSHPIYNHILAAKDCLATPTSLMRLNLKTVKVEDIEKVESPFEYYITKTGVMHGLASWFEVKFGAVPPSYGCDAVTLSTSPHHPLTHWKQDLLMLDDPIPVQNGDRILGSILIERNRLWRRHLRVNVKFTQYREEVLVQEVSKEYTLWR